MSWWRPAGCFLWGKGCSYDTIRAYEGLDKELPFNSGGSEVLVFSRWVCFPHWDQKQQGQTDPFGCQQWAETSRDQLLDYWSNCWNFSRLDQNPNFSLHFDHFRMVGLLVPFFSDYAMVCSILYTTSILPTSWCFTTSSPCRSSYWMIKVWEIGWCLGFFSLKFGSVAGHFWRGDGWLHFSFLGAGRMWFFLSKRCPVWWLTYHAWYIETETVSRWRKTMAGRKIQHASRL